MPHGLVFLERAAVLFLVVDHACDAFVREFHLEVVIVGLQLVVHPLGHVLEEMHYRASSGDIWREDALVHNKPLSEEALVLKILHQLVGIKFSAEIHTKTIDPCDGQDKVKFHKIINPQKLKALNMLILNE